MKQASVTALHSPSARTETPGKEEVLTADMVAVSSKRPTLHFSIAEM